MLLWRFLLRRKTTVFPCWKVRTRKEVKAQDMVV